MARPHFKRILFAVMFFGGVSLAFAQAAPTATATCGPVGNPPTKGWVRVDGTWDNCGTTADKAEVTLWRKTPPLGQYLNQQTAQPVAGKGSLGGDVGAIKLMQSGDTVYAVTKIYDKTGKLIVEKQSADYTVP